MSSTAVALNRISRIVGYQLTKGTFNTSSPNLPQRIAVLAEASTANQSGLSTSPVQITSAAQAGKLYGFSSPMYAIMRILFPVNGGGVTVPVIAFAQLAAGGSAAKAMTITVTGTATANGTHYININGREIIDGSAYAVNIVNGDTPTVIAGKIVTAINNVLSCPVSAANTAGVVTCTAEWTGLTSQDISITVDSNNTSIGVTYAVAQTVAGTGTPTVTSSLQLFGSDWNTIVINGYGAVSATMAEYEAFNGIPDPNTPSGRYTGTIFKPFIALTGSTLDNPTSITSAGVRPSNVTI